MLKLPFLLFSQNYAQVISAETSERKMSLSQVQHSLRRNSLDLQNLYIYTYGARYEFLASTIFIFTGDKGEIRKIFFDCFTRADIKGTTVKDKNLSVSR